MPQEIKQQVFEVRNTSKKKLSFPDLKQVPPLSPEQTIDLFQYVSAADLAKSRSFQRHLMRRRIEAKQKLIGITNSQSSEEPVKKHEVLIHNRTIYVRQNGDDEKGNGDAATPYRQVSRALQDVEGAVIAAHYVISVGGGSYEQFVVSSLLFARNGSLSIEGTSHAELDGTRILYDSSCGGSCCVGVIDSTVAIGGFILDGGDRCVDGLLIEGSKVILGKPVLIDGCQTAINAERSIVYANSDVVIGSNELCSKGIYLESSTYDMGLEKLFVFVEDGNAIHLSRLSAFAGGDPEDIGQHFLPAQIALTVHSTNRNNSAIKCENMSNLSMVAMLSINVVGLASAISLKSNSVAVLALFSLNCQQTPIDEYSEFEVSELFQTSHKSSLYLDLFDFWYSFGDLIAPQVGVEDSEEAVDRVVIESASVDLGFRIEGFLATGFLIKNPDIEIKEYIGKYVNYDADPIWGLNGSRGNFYHQYVGKKLALPERW